MSNKGLKNKPLVVAFVTIFLDLLGFGIIIPVSPFFVESLGAKPFVVTLIGASYSLMQFLFAPFWGRMSDRVGRRPIILVSVLMSGIGHLIFSLAGSVGMIFAARMLAGFGNANLGTAQAIISDSTTAENRAKGMGLIGAAFGLGFLFGPAIGGVLGQINPLAPSFGAFVLAMINFALAYYFLPETKSEKSKPSERKVFSFEAFKNAFKNMNLALLMQIAFIYTIAFALMEQVLGLLMERSFVSNMVLKPGDDHISASARLTAIILVCVGMTAVIIQGGLIGRSTKKFGEKKLLTFGLICASIAIGLMPLIAKGGVFTPMIGASVLLAIGTGHINPSLSSLVSRVSDQTKQGEVMGLYQSISALGRVVGPALAGLLFEFEVGFPFFAGSFLFFLAVILSLRVKQPKP